MSLQQVLTHKRLVMDGALGTQLEGLVPRDSPVQPKSSPLWSGMVLLHQPELVANVHRQYVDAGADVLLTGTYQTSAASLKANTALTDPEIRELWGRSVEVAAAAAATAADRKVWVFGSVGPYATFLADGSEYTGKYDQEDLEALGQYHRPLVQFLHDDPRVDVLAFETIPSFAELQAILHLMAHGGFSKPFYVSFNFADANRMVDGTPITEVAQCLARALEDHPALQHTLVGIGLNCINFELIDSIIRSLNACCSFPLFVYPNLGFEFDETLGEYCTKKNTCQWIANIQKWCTYDNVRAVGGCCGTSPTEIAAVKQTLASLP